MHLNRLSPSSERDGENTVLMTFALGTANEPNIPTGYVDPFDDVFGSAPSSPVVNAQDVAEPGRVTSSEPATVTRRSRSSAHTSDIRRLREAHVTNGYREGIAVSKEKHVQQGFDEGYSLGAELALNAGWCLGALEGLAHALLTDRGPVDSESSRRQHQSANGRQTMEEVKGLCADAERELTMQHLLGNDYFGADGLWLYHVPIRRGEEVVTHDMVAKAHPLIAKWVSVVRQRARECGLALE